MISMAEKDRDVLRFLWVDDAFAEELNVVELRFTRVRDIVKSLPTQRNHLSPLGEVSRGSAGHHGEAVQVILRGRHGYRSWR